MKFSQTRDEVQIETGSLRRDSRTVFFGKGNGIGIDMKYSVKLLSVFQWLNDEKEYEGTGMGLAIVYRIIHRHGGTIWADSKVDNGSVFSFTLD